MKRPGRGRRMRQRAGPALVALIAVALLAAGYVALQALTFAPFVPNQTDVGAGEQFRSEFPGFYHFLSSIEGFSDDCFWVQRGLGGRWGRLELKAVEPAAPAEQTRETLVSHFEANGWSRSEEKRPTRLIVNAFDCEAAQVSVDDLEFTRERLGEARENVSHYCRIHFDEHGGRITVFAEMGW